ncbi:MAG: ferritin-like domain-containing protein [Acidimicrobiales bacterium]
MEPPGPGDFRLDRRQLLQAGVAGGTLLRFLHAEPAGADQALDVQILQTSASIENAAVSAYDAVLALPLLTGPTANAALTSLFVGARNHHVDHARAFNDAAGSLGGKAQTAPNPALGQIGRERSRLTDLATVLDLAVELETAAAQTYQSNVAAIEDLNARKVSASIAGVEAQHLSVFLVARALVAAGTPDLISLDAGVAGRLPPQAGGAGFPDTFSKVDRARAADEGAVR